MKIIFFSEIRWDYLKTRKQQIISRFPKEWEILFFEPYKKGKKTSLSPVWHDNVCAATMPLFFKNFKPTIIKWLLSFKLVRFIILLVGWLWTKEIIRRTEFHAPDLIMCSNIYAAPFVKMLAGERIPVIYEMNDDHLAFPNTPEWAKGYFESLCTVASRITMPSKSMKKLLPIWAQSGSTLITNGVDYNLFVGGKKIILYIGAISDWLNVELLESVAKSFPDAILRLIGPVSRDVNSLKKLPNVQFFEPLNRIVTIEQMRQADVCLVPFLEVPLTAHTDNINKVFEYLATGKPIVSIGRPKADFENKYPGLIYSAASLDDFIFGIKKALLNGNTKLAEMRKEFAKNYDWSKKANEMVELIEQITKSKHEEDQNR